MIFAAILLVSLFSGATVRADQFDAVRFKIHTVMTYYNINSVTVAVAKDGKIIWEEGFGWSDIERKIPATPHTPYSLASISKPVTATALMILAERGLIDLDKPMNDYLGKVKLTTNVGDVSQATVRRIGDHTGGLPIHIQYFYEDESAERPSMDETIRRYGVLVRPPGEAFEYSNLDYGLIEYAIERASGKSYAKFLQDEVFRPLGLTDSAVNRTPDFGNRVAIRYWGDHVVPFYDFDARGAAAVFMSADDLVRFGMFHLGDPLAREQKPILRERSILSMRDTKPLNNGQPNTYGLGWMVEPRHGMKWFGHGGGMAGVATWLSVYPDAGVVVVVLGNGISDVGAVHFLENDIVHAVLPDSIRYDHGFKPIAGQIGLWKGFVHTYTGKIAIEIDIRANGSIFTRIGGGVFQEVTSVTLDEKTSVLSLDNILGTVGTPDSERYSHRIQMALALRGADVLNGEIVANSTESLPDRMGSALSYWVELHKH
jgi:CubicO group peptidase (beta-lactamase class C family)